MLPNRSPNRRAAPLLFALLLAPLTALAAGSAAFAPEHLELTRRVDEPRLSPDGRWLVYTVSWLDFESDHRRSQILLQSVDGGEPRVVAEGDSPCWSPDGRRLAYLAKAGGEREGGALWLYDLERDRPRLLTPVHQTDHFLGHRARRNFAWSPDGAAIAFIGAEPPRREGGAGEESDVVVIDRLLFKTRTGFSDNRRSHVWLVSTAGEGMAEARPLTPGPWDEHSLAFSPDGRRVAFASNRAPDPDDAYDDDLFTVDVASGEITRLTDTPGPEYAPAFSPDGSRLAFLAMRRQLVSKDSPAKDAHLYVMPASPAAPDRGEALDLIAELDRRVRDFAWSPDGGSLLFVADDRGRRPLLRVAAEGGAVEEVLGGRGQVGDFHQAANTLAYTHSTFTAPEEVWLAGAGGAGARPLTRVQRPLLDAVALHEAEEFWFESFDGTAVQGWVMKPAGFAAGRRYPLVMWIHGGPHGMYGDGFSERLQLAAGAGFGVLFLNPRGSSGYGQAFSDGCVLNWGGGDYRDLMAGLDHALARHPWIDPERLGVVGSSYGGYMTNWIVTRTHRFRAAVASASLSNLVSFYGTSLYHLLVEAEFDGRPWRNYPLLWQWSPLAHVEGARTPTLFLHGEADHDVPITQAEEMFVALKKQGVETRLVRYPGEGHGIRRPSHQLDYHRRILEWFGRFLKE